MVSYFCVVHIIVHDHMPVTTSEVVKPRKGKTRKPRSLLLLLKSFVGLRVRIELKNDCVIEGVVQEVLNDMDFTLLDACETKSSVRLDELFCVLCAFYRKQFVLFVYFFRR